jgi:uncharacterized protein YndB with AHSA1/START domain
LAKGIYVETLIHASMDEIWRLTQTPAEHARWSVQRYRIEVNVANRRWGPLFGYRGQFDVEWRKVTQTDFPKQVMPTRYERRE